MQGTTHIIGGIAAAIAYSVATQPQPNPALLVAAAVCGGVGGLIPDIDHPRSKISNKLPILNSIVSFFFSHRGFFHTPILYLALWSLSIAILPPSLASLASFVWLGTLSHLALDMLNQKGVPLLFPFTRKKFSWGRIRLGGKLEFGLRAVLGLVSIAMLVQMCSSVT
jgi:inner membrane protein